MFVLTRSHSVLTPLISIVRYAMASKVEGTIKEFWNFKLEMSELINFTKILFVYFDKVHLASNLIWSTFPNLYVYKWQK